MDIIKTIHDYLINIGVDEVSIETTSPNDADIVFDYNGVSFNIGINSSTNLDDFIELCNDYHKFEINTRKTIYKGLTNTMHSSFNNKFPLFQNIEIHEFDINQLYYTREDPIFAPTILTYTKDPDTGKFIACDNRFQEASIKEFRKKEDCISWLNNRIKSSKLTNGLKLCPFCGGSPEVYSLVRTSKEGKKVTQTFVRCTNCEARGKAYYDHEKKTYGNLIKMARIAWNNRFT